ncbi:MAG: transcriptional regulator NrdR [Coriobacteriia bacterium]|nr:transcriptional repressor NrdR [Coriobacteriaceae bacterium]MDO4399585.1 transcriptional regulator NrdR [Coriobacteriia bacterium]
MRCPNCSYLDSKVVDSRPSDDGMTIRRRRECLSCGRRFTTYERLGESPLTVTKSDGSSEVYNRHKLFRGMLTACAKRPITSDQINALIDDIESELRASNTNQIASKRLGDMALERLAGLDDVAYIRFASVYKDFKSIEEFKQALEDYR